MNNVQKQQYWKNMFLFKAIISLNLLFLLFHNKPQRNDSK